MKNIKEKENQIIFTADIDETLANAIRRYLNQIPVLAVDEVEISKNDSPLYDETISHMIGLIPLKMSKSVNEKTEYKIDLNTKKEGMIYSEELKGEVKPVYDKIPITSLKKGQELELVGFVKAGKGSDHSKFSPGLMFYRNIFEVKVDKECPKEAVEVCPQDVFKIKDGKVVVEDESKCDMCEACIEFCQKRKKDSIEIKPKNELLITLESFGQLEPKNIFEKSIEVLKKDLELFSKKVSK